MHTKPDPFRPFARARALVTYAFVGASILALSTAYIASDRLAIGFTSQQPPASAPKAPATKDAAPKADKPAETPASYRFGRAKPIARTPGTFRLMTYNIENLFDDKDDPTLSGRSDDKDMTKPADHCKNAADAIRAADPDVIALQEIESYDALIQFRDTYLKGMGYDHVVSIDSGDPRGIENAVLSRFPLSDPKVYRDMPLGGVHPDLFGNDKNDYAGQPIAFKRSPLRVTVEIPEGKVAELIKQQQANPDPTKPAAQPADAKPYKLTLFVAHQKSGRGGDYWRERESAKTVELAKEVLAKDPKANIIILGDFNAMTRDDSVKIYERAGYIDLFKDTPDRDLSTITHASNRRIDHVLYNPAAANEIVLASRFVLATATRPERTDFRTTPPPKGYASDHFPVVVDIKPIDESVSTPSTPTAPAAPAAPAPAKAPAR